MKNYQDMRTGIINLNGIRNIIVSDAISYGPSSEKYTISVQYKGIGTQTYRYESRTVRDAVYEEIKKKLLG